MIDYVQPDFYRFNQDSLELVRFVLSQITAVNSILDIGAGSGIIGIELARTLKPEMLILLELQPDFRAFLDQNIALFLRPPTQTSVRITSLGEWESPQRFDLIVCNPPYYLPGHGQESSDQRRNLCRNFKQDGWDVLLKKIPRWLSPQGKAFIVMKKDETLLRKCGEAVSSSGLKGRFHFEQDLAFLELSHGTEYKSIP